MADRLGAVALHRHGDDVEAASRVIPAAHPQPVLGEPDEPAALVPRDGVAGPLSPGGTPALDLDEDDDVAVAADEIDLAVAKPHVALQHGKAGGGQPARRGIFGGLSDRSPAVAHALRIRR